MRDGHSDSDRPTTAQDPAELQRLLGRPAPTFVPSAADVAEGTPPHGTYAAGLRVVTVRDEMETVESPPMTIAPEPAPERRRPAIPTSELAAWEHLMPLIPRPIQARSAPHPRPWPLSVPRPGPRVIPPILALALAVAFALICLLIVVT